MSRRRGVRAPLAAGTLVAALVLRELAVPAPRGSATATFAGFGEGNALRLRERRGLARRALPVPYEVRKQLLDAGVCGDISDKIWENRGKTFVLETDRGECFVKCGTGGKSAPVELLQYEAEGLRRIGKAAKGALKVPNVYMVGELGPGRGFIAMEKLKLGRQATTKDIGIALRTMHEADPPEDWKTFGFPMDGCCGACPQLNNPEGREMSWLEFWREFRLGHQLEMWKERSPDDKQVQELGKEIVDHVLPELFEPLGDFKKASLLHGDLWSGNIAALKDGTPVLLDPACYYGHPEADHGINAMFGGCTAFRNRGYQSGVFAELLPDYHRRLTLYEMHHHMNHFNIFGSGYRASTLAKMELLTAGRN